MLLTETGYLLLATLRYMHAIPFSKSLPTYTYVTCKSSLYKNLGDPMVSAGSPMVTPLFKFLHLVEVVSHSHLTQVSSQAQAARPYQLRPVLGQFQPGFHGYVDPVEALYRGQRPLL